MQTPVILYTQPRKQPSQPPPISSSPSSVCFCGKSTWREISSQRLLSAQFRTANCRCCILQRIRRTYSSCTTETLFFHFPSLKHGHHYCTLCFYVSLLKTLHVSGMECLSYNFGLFQSNRRLWDEEMQRANWLKLKLQSFGHLMQRADSF